MTPHIAANRAIFRKLHETGCFVLPNPWDVGGARMLQSLGYKAIASTSAGFAWSIGRADNRVSLDEVLDHLAALSHGCDLPVNADFENGFAKDPEALAMNVSRAVDAGVSGLSVEDLTGDADHGLFDLDYAVERIAACRNAIDASETGVILVARTEGLLIGALDATGAIARLVAYAEAGADCLYAPGLRRPEDIAALVAAVAPKPVNVLVNGPGLTVAEAAALGVRRISIGGALARAAWSGFLKAAEEIAASGDFAVLAQGAPGKRLNETFAGFGG
ncbi:isocitrate lyase/phosphoenolpyruvate mutase family protein [soil metagenome]